MSLYIRELDGISESFQFPVIPEKITVSTGVKFQSYDIISGDEIKIPNGEEPTTFQWDGLLPGPSRRNTPLIDVPDYAYKTPEDIQEMFSWWKKTKNKFKIFVNNTPISHLVYLERYEVTYSGGYGDYNYNIQFSEAKDLLVYSETEKESQEGSTEETVRATEAGSKTYTVKKGDSLWKIAQAQLGNGSRYMEIYNLNKDKIKNPNSIIVGMSLRLP